MSGLSKKTVMHFMDKIRIHTKKKSLQVKKANKILQNLRHEIHPQLFDEAQRFLQSESWDMTSDLWRKLFFRHLESLSIEKASQFTSPLMLYGKKIARNYFTFTNIELKSIKGLFSKHANKLGNYTTMHEGFTLSESLELNLQILLLYEELKSSNLERYLEDIDLEVFALGGHPKIRVGKQVLTLDSLAAIFEFDFLRKYVEKEKIYLRNVVEIGAGSGRFAQVLVKVFNDIKYVITDIPPASYISKARLSAAFPSAKFFQGLDMPEQMDLGLQIIHLFPHELMKMDTRVPFDFAISIDSFQELDLVTQDSYLDVLSRSSLHFYLKVANPRDLGYFISDVSIRSTDDLISRIQNFGFRLMIREDSKFPEEFTDLIFCNEKYL
jgi:putative sugar O-methyltransferase